MKKVLYILGELQDMDVEWMLDTGRRRVVRPGEVLIREGQPIDALYIVASGAFDVSVGASGLVIAKLGAGEVLGEISFVDARPPTASVTARDDSVVLAIGRDALQRKLATDTGFASRFYRALSVFLADRLRDTVRQMGYGTETNLDQGSAVDEDELDLDRLEHISRGGVHFERIVHRLQEV